MAHTIVTDVCEGIADCQVGCPVNCINKADGVNKNGSSYYVIDFSICIDCGICLQICPIKGAVIPEEKPELQR